MEKWTELITGLVILVGVILISWMSSIYSWTIFGKNLDFLSSAWIFFKGGIFWLILMIGLLFIVLGINDLRE